MTTKIKIITGFLFMALLLVVLVVVGYSRLNMAEEGFAAYRKDANTAVYANAADALLREAKDRISTFIVSLEPKLMDDARANLERSVGRVKQAIEFEPNSLNRDKLSEQIVALGKMNSLTRAMQEKLVNAEKIVTGELDSGALAIGSALDKIVLEATIDGNADVLAQMTAAYAQYSALRVAMRVYSITYLPEDGQSGREAITDFQNILNKIVSLPKERATAEAVDMLAKAFNGYLDTAKRMSAEIKDGLAARTELGTLSAGLMDFFDDYTEEAQNILDKIGAQMDKDITEAKYFMGVSGVIGVVVGVLFAAWIIVGVVRVLTRVSIFAGEVGKGNFNAALDVREGGEIGDMVKSIKSISSILNDVAAEFAQIEQKVENGYLDVRGDVAKFSGGFANLVVGTNNIMKRTGIILDNIPSPLIMFNSDLKAGFLNKAAKDLAGGDYQGKTCAEMFAREDYGTPDCGMAAAAKDLRIHSGETIAHPKGKRMDISYTDTPMLNAQGKLASMLEFIVDLTAIKDTERKIKEVADHAMANADRVAAASEELSAQVEQVSRGAEMQRSRVDSTATAMSEMNSTVLEVARSAGSASEQSENTRSRAEGGAELVNRVVKAINNVNTVALGLQDNMKELGQQAEGIGGVMNVISDIADQTNLLALNAAIEAARAGEAGRGFAVVADEVRKLAEKTMSATQEVGNNIQAIQNSTRTNINEVTSAVKNISEATDLANASGQSLNEIVNLASANSAVVSSIAAAAEEQSATSEEINRSLEEISQIVAETSDGMTQASAAVQDLAHTAQQLRVIMDKLRS